MVLVLTKPGAVTELIGPLFTVVFVVPEESDHCRMDLAASDGEITRTSSAEAILDSLFSETEI